MAVEGAGTIDVGVERNCLAGFWIYRKYVSAKLCFAENGSRAESPCGVRGKAPRPFRQVWLMRLSFLCGKMGKYALFVEKNTYTTTAFDRLRRLSVLYYGQAPEEIPKGTGFGQK